MSTPISKFNRIFMVAFFVMLFVIVDIVGVIKYLDSKIERVNYAMYFYNATDHPPALPFMSIIFVGLPESRLDQAKVWREEIDQKILDRGGVYRTEDYNKITSVVPDYVKAFTESGAKAIALEFPRERRGMLLRDMAPKK
jgi:hypothetical protein